MSTSLHKRKEVVRPARVPDTRPRIVSPAALIGAVEQATDLGNGYVVVKVARSRQGMNVSEGRVPAVPDEQLRRLFEKILAGSEPDAPDRRAKRAPAVRRVEEDNAELILGLDAKAMARRQDLHERGLLLTSAQLCDRLHITRQALSKAVKENRMFWIDGPAGARWYPSFFATGPAHRRDIARVSIALADLPGPAKWQFFTTPKHSLEGKTPLAALERGLTEQVLRTAVEARERSIGR